MTILPRFQCWALLLLLAGTFYRVQGQGNSFLVQQCSATQVFDLTSLSCGQCSANFATRLPDTQQVDPMGNVAACKCATGYRTDLPTCDTSSASICPEPTCTDCVALGQAAARDGSACMACDAATATLDSSTRDCVCNTAGWVLMESDSAGAMLAAKTCAPCGNGTRVFTTATGSFPADPYTCVKCEDPNMSLTASGLCVCNTGYVATGVAALGAVECVPQAQTQAIAGQFPEVSATAFTFRSVRTPSGEVQLDSVVSLWARHLYLRSATRCWNWRTVQDSTACSALANLCVLHMYDSSAPPCAAAKRITGVRGGAVHGWQDWAATIPWLDYTLDAAAVLQTDYLKQQYSFNEATQENTVDQVRFLLASYHLNGSLVGLAPLTSQLQFCSSGPVGGAAPAWLHFGASASVYSVCDLAALAKRETLLFELYFVDVGGAPSAAAAFPDSLPVQVYPVPVRLVNYRGASGAQPNVNVDPADINDDVFVHRFFLWDTAAGATTTGNALPTVLRYAKTVELTMDTQAATASKLRPPVLTLTYEAVQTSFFASTDGFAETDLTLYVSYTSQDDTFSSVTLAFFAMACVFIALATGVRMYNWRRRNTRTLSEQVLTGEVLAQGVLFLAGAFATGLFWLAWILCLYWLLFFKLQDAVFQLMPLIRPDSRAAIYDSLEALVWACVCLQAARIFDVLRQQCNAEVFFIDWEKPRGPLLHTGDLDELPENATPEADALEGKAEPEHKSAIAQPSFQAPGPGTHAGGGAKPAEQVAQHGFAPISVWRTLFMANEWAELATARRLNLVLTLLVLVALLDGLNLKNLAVTRPGADNLSDGPLNPALQFANDVFWWLLLAGVQVLWSWGVAERFLDENPTLRYLDLCTVAKISLLVLPDRYAGWYLHADAPYEFADCNMRQLTERLNDESGGGRIGRGLPGAPDNDAQSFELHLPKTWRDQFDSLYANLDAALAALPPVHGKPAGYRGPRAAAEATVQRGAGSTGDNMAATAQNKLRKTGMKDVRDKEALALQAATCKQVATFLRGFVTEDESGPPVRRVWREKTYLQRFLHTPPDMRIEEAAAGVTTGGGGPVAGIAVMYPDRGSTAVEGVMFRGAEWELLLWDMLVFSAVDISSGSPVVAALVTWLAATALAYIRIDWGRSNIARKTLVDDRFLV